MRLVTLNTWGTRGDWPRRREAMRAGFAALDADVITLQETIVTDRFDQARELLGDGYELVHQPARARRPGDHDRQPVRGRRVLRGRLAAPRGVRQHLPGHGDP